MSLNRDVALNGYWESKYYGHPDATVDLIETTLDDDDYDIPFMDADEAAKDWYSRHPLLYGAVLAGVILEVFEGLYDTDRISGDGPRTKAQAQRVRHGKVSSASGQKRIAKRDRA